jgi:hypothetical protein
MEKQKEQWKRVLDKAEFIAIVTSGDEGAHTVGTWGDYARTLGIEGEEVRIPAWGYHKTEENIRKGSPVELLMGSKNIQRPSGKFGQGCKLSGKGEFQTSGNLAELTKKTFPGSRGVLIVKVEKVLYTYND